MVDDHASKSLGMPLAFDDWPAGGIYSIRFSNEVSISPCTQLGIQSCAQN